jgi:hypothetical protein
MELDDLKDSWKQTNIKKITNTNIMELIQHKSYGPVSALKRAFAKQIKVMIIIPLILLLTNLDDVGKVLTSVMFWSYVIFCIVIIVFSYYNYRLVEKMEDMVGLVKSRLEQQIHILETRLKGNIVAVRIGLLFFIFLTEVLPYFQHYRMLDKWHSLNPIIRYSVYALFLILQYFLSKSISQKKYGKHLSYLKELVEEMQ